MVSDEPRKPRSTKNTEKDSINSATAPARVCVLVSGMHRSGTSMLAGILSRVGCTKAEHLLPENFANEKGYYESAPIAVLNDQILISAGSDWSDWAPVNPGWFTSTVAGEFRERAETLLMQEFGESRLFVLKDPRICRLMPFWRDVFAANGITLRVLHIHRNPLEVAASLEKRDAMNPEFGQLLWLRHVLEAEVQSRDLPRYFTSYSNVVDNWAEEIKAAASALDLNWPRMSTRVAAEVRDFISSDLKHFRLPPDQLLRDPLVSSWTRDTFEIMDRWSRGITESGDTQRLDEIRAQLDQSVPAFAGLLNEGLTNAKILRKASDLTEQYAEIEDRISQLQSQHDVVLDQLRQTTNLVEQHARRVEELSALRHVNATKLAEKEAELTRTRAKMEALIFERGQIMNSRSWRVTAPLRKLTPLLRR